MDPIGECSVWDFGCSCNSGALSPDSSDVSSGQKRFFSRMVYKYSTELFHEMMYIKYPSIKCAKSSRWDTLTKSKQTNTHTHKKKENTHKKTASTTKTGCGASYELKLFKSLAK